MLCCFCEVESYRPADNKWTIRSPLNTKKGALAGATWKDKIFAIGGGNVIGCFSEVEMYDPQVGRWINTRPMSQKVSFNLLVFACSANYLLQQQHTTI